MASKTYRADIQGLRAIAVLVVVAFHAGLPIHGGFIGVDVFFVVSGFVISRLLIAEIEATGTLRLSAFYGRRARRLLPALATMLVVVAIAAVWLLNPDRPQVATARTGAAASLFAANLQLLSTPHGYFNLDSGSNALLHTWSLSIEEQFYLLFPGCLLIIWRIGRRAEKGMRRIAFALTTVVLATSFGFSYLTCHGHGASLARLLGSDEHRLAFYLPFARIWEFGGGIVVGVVAPRIATITRATAELAGTIGVVSLGFGLATIDAAAPFPGAIAAWPVIGTMLIIVAGFHERSLVSRFLSLRPLVWIGDVSYGWYLWHWPMIVFAHAVWPSNEAPATVAAFAALVPTVMSYRWIEEPIRHNPRIVGWRVLGVSALCIAASLAACGALRFARSLWLHHGAGPGIITAHALHQDGLEGCGTGTRVESGLSCMWPTSASKKGTIYLAGDSNAGQFTEAVVASGNSLGYDVITRTHHGCAFVDLEAKRPRNMDDMTDSTAALCRAFVLDSVAAIVKAKPALVIVASDSSDWVEDPTDELRDPHTNERAKDADHKASLWESGLREAVAPLSAAGIRTVVVAPIPHPFNVELETCPAFRIMTDVDECAPPTSRSTIDQYQRRAREAERRATSSLPDVTVFDVTPQLCDARECVSRRDDTWLYRDPSHLSVAGVMVLEPTFARLIAERAR